MAVLVLDQVVKRFGDFTAVDGLSFTVPEGGIFGFLGGNGAGKTTSVRMMLDIIRPTSGRIEILGRPPARENAPRIGLGRGLVTTVMRLQCADTQTRYRRNVDSSAEVP